MDIAIRNYTEYTNLLPDQFKNSEKLKKLLTIFLEEDQEFFDELYKLFEVGLDLETATGYQLDIIGKLITEYRKGRDDEEYREAIRFSQFISNSSGTIPELIYYLKQITNSSIVRVFEHYPATVCMELDGDKPTPNTLQLTDESAVAGVDVHSIIYTPDNIAVRPVSVKEAYDNQVGDLFLNISNPSNRLYYSQRPAQSSLLASDSLASRPYMVAGNSRAVATGKIKYLYINSVSTADSTQMYAGNEYATATGLTLLDETEKKGRHPEVYKREG